MGDDQIRHIVRTAMAKRSWRVTADLAGVSTRTVQRALNGKNIRVQTLMRIAEAGGYSVRLVLEKDTK